MVGGERSRPRGSSLVEVDGSHCGATVETQWRHCGATVELGYEFSLGLSISELIDSRVKAPEGDSRNKE